MDKTVKLWDLGAITKLPKKTFNFKNSIRSAKFNTDGTRIITESDDEPPTVLDFASGQKLFNLSDLVFGYSAEFSSDGTRIVAASEKQAFVCDSTNGAIHSLPMTHDEAINSVRIDKAGKLIVTASGDETAKIWDAHTGRQTGGALTHSAAVNTAEFSPTGEKIVTASQDGTARVWDAITGEPLTEAMTHAKEVSDAEFSPDGKLVVTSSRDGTARIWDSQTGLPLTDSLIDGGVVESAHFSSDGKRIITASQDSTARIWDIAFDATNQTPIWLAQLAEAISGQIINNQGAVAPTKLNQIATLETIRHDLNQSTNTDDWTIWGRWLLADPAERTISPFSKVSVPQYIQDRINENTLESLDEAEPLATGNTNLMAKIAQSRQALEQGNKSD